MLKDFCIPDSVEYVSVEYAKSARSACKACKEKIGLNELRIGILVDDDHFSTGQGTQWFHKACFTFKPRHKALEVSTLNKKIHNLESLEKKDQKEILTYLKAQLQAVKEGKPKTGRSKKLSANKSEKSARSTSKPAKEETQKENVKVKPEKKGKESAASKSKSKAGQKAKKEAPKQQPTRRGLRSQSAATVKFTTSVVEEKPQKILKKPKTLKVQTKKFLTDSQKKEYKDLLEDFNKLSISELKEILGKNNQPKTGTKTELVEKCADGKQFGRIPTCTKCGGGKLRFDRTTGRYTCPGYMEDTDFVNCKSKFEFEEVKRLEWNN